MAGLQHLMRSCLEMDEPGGFSRQEDSSIPGFEQKAQVIGVVFPFQIVSQAVAGTVAGAIFDATSTYTPAFITAACFSLAGLIFVFSARGPRLPQPDSR